VQRVTGRPGIHVWMGECHVHAGISAADLRERVAHNPDSEVLIHPECGCATSAQWLAGMGELPAERTYVLSTGGMLDHARQTTAERVLVATEVGMLHQLRQANAGTAFEPVNPLAVCRYMKMNTPEALLRCVRDGVTEVHVEPGIAARARRAVEAMIAVGTPSPVGE
jgi:quinolinate synthase